MEYEWAQPGRLVVCVQKAWINNPPVEGESFPEYQRVYTIREVKEASGKLYLKFEELRNPAIRGSRQRPLEAQFLISNFRPVNTQIIDNLLKVEENA